MDKKTFNETSEAGILNNLSGSIADIKKKVEPVLTEKANAEVLQGMMKQDSVDTLSTMPDAGSNTNFSHQEQKSKTLVRKAPNAPRVVKSASNTTETPSPKSVNYSSEPVNEVPDNYFDTIRNGGSANASSIFIVIAAFVIVIMVIMICLTIINSFGIGL